MRSLASPDEGFVQMRGTEIVELMMDRGLDQVDASVLVVQALSELGGLNLSQPRRWSLGTWRRRWEEDFWVPQAALDEAPTA
jgi:hypothetical protein